MSATAFLAYLLQKAKENNTSIHLHFSTDQPTTTVIISAYGKVAKAAYMLADYDVAIKEDYYKDIVDRLIDEVNNVNTKRRTKHDN